MKIRVKSIGKYIIITLCIYSNFSFSDNSSNKESLSSSLENGVKLEDIKPKFDNFDEVTGLIIDRTMTRFGEDFYFFFTQKLNEKYDNLNENFMIKERPTALSGSIISVFHSRKLIYRTALSPGKRQAEEKADEAINAVSTYLTRWQIERLFMDTFDLDYDEF